MTAFFAEYELTKQVSAGAAAQLWQAKDSDGAVCALKVFTTPNELALAAAERECALSAQIDHPHLAQVRRVVHDGDRIAVEMEFVDGQSLAELVDQRGNLTAAQTATVLLPLAAALATAHERGVVHGDLAPANVMVDRTGRPVLVDLGSARAEAESPSVAAHPGFQAPELARSGALTPAADVFSLGALALWCLTGRAAWAAESFADVAIQATVGQWPDPGNGPLARITRQMLSEDPAERPGAAQVYLTVKKAVGPQPIPVRIPPNGRHYQAGGDEVVEPGGSLGRIRAIATKVRPETVLAELAAAETAEPVRPWPARLAGAGVVLVLLVAVTLVALRWLGGSEGPPVTANNPVGTPPDSAVGATAAGSVVGPSTSAGADVVVSSAPASNQAEVDYAQVVTDLDTTRAQALTSRDEVLLAKVYLPGSPALAADQDLIRQLTTARQELSDARHHLQTVTFLGAEGDQLRVQVVDQLPEYAIRNADGEVIGHTAARGAMTTVFYLARTDQGYRIARLQR